MGVIYYDFSKAFDKVLFSSLVTDTVEHEMDNWTVR